MPGQFTWDSLHKHCSPPPRAQHCPHWAYFSHEGHALCDQHYQQLKLVCSTSHWNQQQVQVHSVSSFQWHLITSAVAPTLSTGVFLSVFHFPSLPEQLEPVVKALLPFFHDYYDGLRPFLKGTPSSQPRLPLVHAGTQYFCLLCSTRGCQGEGGSPATPCPPTTLRAERCNTWTLQPKRKFMEPQNFFSLPSKRPVHEQV